MSINALGSQSYAQDIYNSAMNKSAKAEKAVEKKAVAEVPEGNNISAANEEKLSEKAKALIERLRTKYGNMDFYVGNTEEEQKALSCSGSKEYSVVISAEELEKMAEDEDYEDKMSKQIESSVDMCKRILEQYGYKDAENADEDSLGVINKISIAIGDDGIVKMFAELTKNDSKQADSVKRTTVEATNEDDFITQLKNINWKTIGESFSGDKFDFSV